MNKLRDLALDDHWIRQHRSTKNKVDPFKPYHVLLEKERTPEGITEKVLTVFLTNRECRFKCLMCDLWKNTTDTPVPPGAIPAQIEQAMEQHPGATRIKLYNGANFFDPGSIPPADYPRIAELVESFHTVIVENHPLLTGDRCANFAQMIRPRLQVAMGLETIHPEVLPRLNKKMNPEDFRRSVEFLNDHGIGSRAFILLRPPFLTEQEGIFWAKKSMVYAFESGVESCTVIPTRSGNGAMDLLQHEGHFTPPILESLEQVQEFGIGLNNGLAFVDTWDLRQFSTCESCFYERFKRMERINLTQEILPPVRCSSEHHT